MQTQTQRTPVFYVGDLDIDVGRGGRGGGFTVKGIVTNAAELAPIAAAGELVIGDLYITANDSHGHMWNGTAFVDLGHIFPAGPTGNAGPRGIAGPQGAASTMTGPTGPTGPAGSGPPATGPTGPAPSPGSARVHLDSFAGGSPTTIPGPWEPGLLAIGNNTHTIVWRMDPPGS